MNINVGELKRKFSIYPDECELFFGGLDFYRLKLRGEKLLQFEFNQPVYLDSKGRVVVENP